MEKLALETMNTLIVSIVFYMVSAHLTRSLSKDVGRSRILEKARQHFFAFGYSKMTMDELAAELGMSKKTLYRHFPGKDAIVVALIHEMQKSIRADADAIMRNHTLTFAEKLRGFAESMIERLGHVQPGVLKDLQRFAPHCHRLIEEVRRDNILHVFGKIFEQGQLCGAVRSDLSSVFLSQLVYEVVNSMMQPATMEYLKLRPVDVFQNTFKTIFGGMLTAKGRKDYEKLFDQS